MTGQPEKHRRFIFRTAARLSRILGICSVMMICCTSCQTARQPTTDQLLARVASTDNCSLASFGSEVVQLQSDIVVLTTAQGPYRTPMRMSQLAGSIAGRLETMATMGTVILPLNEQEPAFESVDAKEVLASRLMTDVCLACSGSSGGPVSLVQAIAGRVATNGTLAAKDAAYLRSLASNLGKASALLGEYVRETDPSARGNIAEQLTGLCIQLKGQ